MVEQITLEVLQCCQVEQGGAECTERPAKTSIINMVSYSLSTVGSGLYAI